jgi:hypothetical protein
LGSLWGAYQLAINTLCGGFDVALMLLRVARLPDPLFDQARLSKPVAASFSAL